jgi:hypothetical protein
VNGIVLLLLVTPQAPVPRLKPEHDPDKSRAQELIAPSVKVKADALKPREAETIPEVSCPVTLTPVGRVPVSPIVSKLNVTNPVRLVPNNAASAAALGLGSSLNAKSRMIAVLISVNGFPA